MQEQGKFILMSLLEFEDYIHNLQIYFTRKINHVQHHHTHVPSYKNFDGKNHFARLTAMERYHVQNNLGQIAQHYTTFPDGQIAVCRSLAIIPAGIKRHNTGAICIENIGNFDLGHDVMTNAQRETITKLTALLCEKFNLEPSSDTIVYHHWFRQTDGVRDNADGKRILENHKSCPGTNFFGGNTVSDFETYFLPSVQRCTSFLKAHQEPILMKGTVAVSQLNVRKGPSKSFERIEAIKKNKIVSIYETKNNWYRIAKAKWVYAEYISIDRHSKVYQK